MAWSTKITVDLDGSNSATLRGIQDHLFPSVLREREFVDVRPSTPVSNAECLDEMIRDHLFTMAAVIRDQAVHALVYGKTFSFRVAAAGGDKCVPCGRDCHICTQILQVVEDGGPVDLRLVDGQEQALIKIEYVMKRVNLLV